MRNVMCFDIVDSMIEVYEETLDGLSRSSRNETAYDNLKHGCRLIDIMALDHGMNSYSVEIDDDSHDISICAEGECVSINAADRVFRELLDCAKGVTLYFSDDNGPGIRFDFGSVWNSAK